MTSRATTLGVCLALLACRSPTEIRVEIATDEECGATKGTIIAAGPEQTPLTTDCSDAGSPLHDIGSVVVVPSHGKSDLVSLKVTLGVSTSPDHCAVDAGGCIVARRMLRYVPHEPLRLPVAMRGACLGHACPEDQTCVRGMCVAAAIPDSNACAAPGGCDESVLLQDGGTNATIADAANTDAATDLLSLAISAGALSPAFDPATLDYNVVPNVASLGVPLTVTPTYSRGSVTVNAAAVSTGSPSPPISLNLTTPTSIDVTFTSAAGTPTHYAIVVPPVQEAYVKASNTAAHSSFGASVALSGDTLAVGAFGESSNATGINGDQTDTSAPNAGAAYVFTRNGAAWSQQAYVKTSVTQTNAQFGESVALSGDTLAVGAPSEPTRGAVYIFTRSGTAWTQQARLTPSDSSASADFGTSVALSGDTLAVGAPYDNQGPGTVYVSTRSGNTWSMPLPVASNAPPGAQVGKSVALAGDTLAVGAPQDSNGTGAAYVFTRSGSNWLPYPALQPTSTGSNFGTSVALAGATLVVGAPSDNTGQGAAYVFTWSGTAWVPDGDLTASPQPPTAANFGWSVALSGQTLAVGAYWESGGASGVNVDPSNQSAHQSGAVYLFVRGATGWSQQAYIKASNPHGGANFGNSVALSNDSLAVGSFFEVSAATGINGNSADTSAPGAGAVYVLR
jgi:hypothetical protein